MQVLWAERILQGARYLAGVSGGSYAVTAATILRLRSKAAFADPGAPAPYGLGSPELDYLRNRTDYLAPGPAGRWNLAIRFVISIAVNVAVVESEMKSWSRTRAKKIPPDEMLPLVEKLGPTERP